MQKSEISIRALSQGFKQERQYLIASQVQREKILTSQHHLQILKSQFTSPGKRISAVLYLKKVTVRTLSSRTKISRKRLNKIILDNSYPTLEEKNLINQALIKEYGADLLP